MRKQPNNHKHLGDLSPNPKNPRTITDTALESLKKSLEEFGDLSGFIWNKKTQRLVGGHQRQKSLPAESRVFITQDNKRPDPQGTCAIGYVETPDGSKYSYREVDWPVSKEMAANIRANNPAGQFDSGAVAKILQDLEKRNFDVELTGFSAKQLVQFLADANSASNNAAVTGRYEVIIECESEKEQQEVYEQLIAEKRKCRLLTF